MRNHRSGWASWNWPISSYPDSKSICKNKRPLCPQMMKLGDLLSSQKHLWAYYLQSHLGHKMNASFKAVTIDKKNKFSIQLSLFKASLLNRAHSPALRDGEQLRYKCMKGMYRSCFNSCFYAQCANKPSKRFYTLKCTSSKWAPYGGSIKRH